MHFSTFNIESYFGIWASVGIKKINFYSLLFVQAHKTDVNRGRIRGLTGLNEPRYIIHILSSIRKFCNNVVLFIYKKVQASFVTLIPLSLVRGLL